MNIASFLLLLFIVCHDRDLVKDGMLLYRHSARCFMAMQWFLDCNPHYWPFVPMTKAQAQIDNEVYVFPTSHPTRSNLIRGNRSSSP